MMSVGKEPASGSYYSKQDNYYFVGSLENVWMGDGAKELGLTGEVDSKVFDEILAGKLPNGKELGRMVDGKNNHRPGHDLTFSAPKSVSILILLGNDKSLLDAHMKAVEYVAKEVEGLISARVTENKITKIVSTDKMVAAAYTHDTSRSHEPQIHTHLVVANATEYQGKWRALATDKINDAGFIETVMKHQVTLGKMYRSALKEMVEAAGHETEIVGEHGLWEVKAVPKEVRDMFSTRSKEIRDSVGENASLHSKDIAALDTRQVKTERDRQELLQEWLDKSESLGFDVKEYLSDIRHKQEIKAPSSGPGVNSKPEQENKIPGNSKPEPESKTPLDDINNRVKPEDTIPSGGPGYNPEQKNNIHRYEIDPESVALVQESVKILSNDKTKFSYHDLLLTAVGLSDATMSVKNVRSAIDHAIEDGSLIPLDKDKGIFTSQVHILDELSIQGMTKEMLQSNNDLDLKKSKSENDKSLQLDSMKNNSIIIYSTSAGAKLQREQLKMISLQAEEMGRKPIILASSLASAKSIKNDQTLRVINKSALLNKDFFVTDNSTIIIDKAEKLSLKETTVLIGYAKESNSQIVFMDSEGRNGVGNALSVLKDAGVKIDTLNESSPKILTSVHSIPDKNERYKEFVKSYTYIKNIGEQVTAVVSGKKESSQVTALIRGSLQESGIIDKNEITVEARTPVYLDTRTRKQINKYLPGMILEYRDEDKSKSSFLISAIHEDTRKISVTNEKGERSVLPLTAINENWRLYERENMKLAVGDEVRAVSSDYENNIKAKDGLIVKSISEKNVTFLNGDKSVVVDITKPVYLNYDYVSSIDGKINDSGRVLALLKARDIKRDTINSLGNSGNKLDIFTAEKKEGAELKLSRMQDEHSPIKLIDNISSNINIENQLKELSTGIHGETQKSVNFAIDKLMNSKIVFSDLDVSNAALEFTNDTKGIDAEISKRVESGELIKAKIEGSGLYVAKLAYEMEKSIIKAIETGKNTQQPLMNSVDVKAINPDLTKGQAEAATLILTTKDQFVAIQGFAGVGKTTMFDSVKRSIQLIPENNRPELIGLAPTHQAVKEMISVGIPSQTLKSFIVEAEKMDVISPDAFKNKYFIIDESSMIGNPDMSEAVQIIQQGGGRGVKSGDVAQLLSPEGSAPFKLEQERSAIDVVIMKEIKRQTDMTLRGAVYDIINGNASAAINKIESVTPDKISRIQGAFIPPSSVIDFQNNNHIASLKAQGVNSIVGAIASDYTSRPKDVRDQTLIVAHINKDKNAINEAIHEKLKINGSLGENEIKVSILRRVKDNQRELNSINIFKVGQVLLVGDKFLDITQVNKDDKFLTAKDELGRTQVFSPFENTNRDVALLERVNISISEGEKVRLTKTVKESGHQANQDFVISKIDPTGRIHLLGKDNNEKIINPSVEKADQLFDYGYAKTGYNHQGASEQFVISLEGAENGRKFLATMRSFYVSTSRTKEHVQVYSDNLSKWKDEISKVDNKILTAHDALEPETQRNLAKQVWSWGTSIKQTKIGQVFLNQNNIDTFASKIIPQSKKYPQTHLAIPLYAENGKMNGVMMKPMIVNKGQIQLGEERVLASPKAKWSILKISKTGKTNVVNNFDQAMKFVKENPGAGLILQLGKDAPSEQLFKVSKGIDNEKQQNEKDIINNVSSLVRNQKEIEIAEAKIKADLQEKTERNRIIESINIQNAQKIENEQLNSTRNVIATVSKRVIADKDSADIHIKTNAIRDINDQQISKSTSVISDVIKSSVQNQGNEIRQDIIAQAVNLSAKVDGVKNIIPSELLIDQNTTRHVNVKIIADQVKATQEEIKAGIIATTIERKEIIQEQTKELNLTKTK